VIDRRDSALRARSDASVATAPPERTARPSGHLRLVEARRRALRQGRLLLFGGIAAAAAIALALVYLHVVLAQRQFQLDDLNAQVQKDSATYQQLRLQVAELGAPDHIISMAEGQLGMVQPSKVVYLTEPPGTPGEGVAAGGLSSAGSDASPARAPAGYADWPVVKSQLAGTP
jgi:cell division protein FtsL